jgi:hypothetical protein
MRSSPVLLVVALVAVALAGCLGGANPPPTAPPTQPPGVVTPDNPGNGTAINATGGNASAIQVKNATGTAAGATVAAPGLGSFATALPTTTDNGGTFDVKPGATGVVVEVLWNGSDALNLYVSPPCSDATGLMCSSYGNTNGTHPAKLVILDGKALNATGSWGWAVYPQANVQGVPFRAYISVFYGAVPTDAYTAAPPGP